MSEEGGYTPVTGFITASNEIKMTGLLPSCAVDVLKPLSCIFLDVLLDAYQIGIINARSSTWKDNGSPAGLRASELKPGTEFCGCTSVLNTISQSLAQNGTDGIFVEISPVYHIVAIVYSLFTRDYITGKSHLL